MTAITFKTSSLFINCVCQYVRLNSYVPFSIWFHINLVPLLSCKYTSHYLFSELNYYLYFYHTIIHGVRFLTYIILLNEQNIFTWWYIVTIKHGFYAIWQLQVWHHSLIISLSSHQYYTVNYTSSQGAAPFLQYALSHKH